MVISINDVTSTLFEARGLVYRTYIVFVASIRNFVTSQNIHRAQGSTVADFFAFPTERNVFPSFVNAETSYGTQRKVPNLMQIKASRCDQKIQSLEDCLRCACWAISTMTNAPCLLVL
jgi:hypothetical protein